MGQGGGEVKIGILAILTKQDYNGKARGVKSGIFLEFASIGEGVIFRGFWMATSDLGVFGRSQLELLSPQISKAKIEV